MKFYPVTSIKAGKESLDAEYVSAHPVGVIRVGSDHLFFRVRLRTYCIPFTDIKRAFRRVIEVPAKVCCGEGTFAIENLVLCDDEKELAVIQLPGTKAARLLMEELKERMPETDFSAPSAKES